MRLLNFTIQQGYYNLTRYRAVSVNHYTLCHLSMAYHFPVIHFQYEASFTSDAAPQRNATQRTACEHSQLIQRVRLLWSRATQ